MHLPLKFADNAVHTVEFRVIPTLNHAKILVMPFLQKISPNINWWIHIITFCHPQLTSVSFRLLPAALIDEPA